MTDFFHSPHTLARFVLDTCTVIDYESNSQEFQKLREFYKQRRLMLAKTDVVDTERSAKRRRSYENEFLSGVQLLELHGPAVFGHSRLGHSVHAGTEDQERLHKIQALLTARRTSKRAMEHDLRDAMHLATAIRYRYDGIITSEKRLLRVDTCLTHDYGFRVVTVPQAVTIMEQRIRKQQESNILKRC